MATKCIRRHRCLSAWCGAVILAVVTLWVSVSLADAPARHYRVAVLTPGLAFSPALEGLREGLVQLGYHEGKDIAFMIEDAQGEVASLASRAARLVEAKPDVIFTVSTAPTAVAKQATTALPIVFAFVADPLTTWKVSGGPYAGSNSSKMSSHLRPRANSEATNRKSADHASRTIV